MIDYVQLSDSNVALIILPTLLTHLKAFDQELGETIETSEYFDSSSENARIKHLVGRELLN